jgi:cell division transport system permease protein
VIFTRQRDVPLDRDASARFLPWLIAFMVYLATLALAAAIAVANVTERWDSGLAGRLTVQVPPPAADASTADQAARIDAVLAELRQFAGVISAAQLSDQEMAALLEPWLGDAADSADLPLPAMIAVTVDPQDPPRLSAMQTALDAVAPGATVDDHQRTLGRLLEVARTLQLLAVLVVALVGAAAIVTVVFVTRTGLSIHRNVIELLHLIGAHDAYVARQFQRHALRLGLGGGALGVALALATVWALGRWIGRDAGALVPDLAFQPWQWGVLAAVPLAAALVAMVTARTTVLRTLAKLS